MKKLLFILFALVMGISTSHAQFGTLGKLYKTAKSAAAKNKKQAQDDYGNKKIVTTQHPYRKLLVNKV